MRYWIFPGSDQKFRLDDFIRDYGFVEWNPKAVKNKIKEGDIAYIYITAPEMRICYKMVVEKVGIPFEEWFDDRSYSRVSSIEWPCSSDVKMVRLKFIKKLDSPMLGISFLIENGLSGVNWIRELKEETVQYIEKHI